MSNLIIMDRKHKRANSDSQWDDPLSINEIKREKARTISIPKDSKNPAHQVLAVTGVQGLIGRKCWCLAENKEMLYGIIQNVIPPDYILLRNRGVARFKDVVSIGD